MPHSHVVRIRGTDSVCLRELAPAQLLAQGSDGGPITTCEGLQTTQ